MLQDYQQGKEIELEELLGVIINKADKYNYPVPFALSLYERLKNKLASNAINTRV